MTSPSFETTTAVPPLGGRVLERLFPNRGFHGWKIVAASFVACALSSPGQTFLLSLFLEPLMHHVGASRVAVSTAYSVATLVAAMMLPLVGAILDRVSARAYFIGALGGMGVAMMGLSVAPSLLVVGVLFFALRLLGQGSLGLGAIKVTAVWFDARRSRALAIGGLGFAFGELVFPGAVQALIERTGWQQALFLMGALYLVVFAPMVGMVMRPRTDADGSDGNGAGPSRRDLKRLAAGEKDGKLGTSLVFWLLIFGLCVQPFVLTALFFHQVALVQSFGWPLAMIGIVFASFAILRIIATYLCGLLFEKQSSMWGITYSGVAFALACGVVFVPMHALLASLLYGGLLGIGAGTSSASNSILWQERYGLAGLGKLQGTVNALRNGVTAFSPPLAALVATTALGFYAIPLWSALFAVGIVFVAPAIALIDQRRF